MPRVVNFEIHAGDPQRAIRFYTDVFGWEFRRWDGPQPFWFVKTGPDTEKGINGGLVPRGDSPAADRETAVSSWVGTVQVDALDEFTRRIVDAGGEITTPRFAIPGMAWMAHARDTEGNVFSLIEHDPDAA